MQTNKVTNGHAAGVNGQELGLANELKLLNCIKDEGWVREHEASLITGMSHYMIGVVVRRLVGKDQIFRERSKSQKQVTLNEKLRAEKKAKKAAEKAREAELASGSVAEVAKETTQSPANPKPERRENYDGNAGFFLRLTAAGADRVDGKSGKDISIPASWRHHALAIQSLNFLATKNNCSFESEACIRHRQQTGKIPDGNLISDTASYYFEQEFSRKSGPSLRLQTDEIARLANIGTTCFIAYPYPAAICGGIDHETRVTNSIRHRWGSPTAPNIKLVRCCFDSLLAFHNMRVSRFETIDLPAMVETPAAKKGQPGVTDQIRGFRWVTSEHRSMGDPIRIEAELFHDGESHYQCTFIEGKSANECHQMVSGVDIVAKSESDDEIFTDFVLSQQKAIEAEIEGNLKMAAMMMPEPPVDPADLD